MQLDIPPRVRVGLYILTALGTPLVAYLQLKNIIGDAEVLLWSAEVTIVSGMAALKVAK